MQTPSPPAGLGPVRLLHWGEHTAGQEATFLWLLICFTPAWLMTRSAPLMSSAMDSLKRKASSVMCGQTSGPGRTDPLPTWRTKRSYPLDFKACRDRGEKNVTLLWNSQCLFWLTAERQTTLLFQFPKSIICDHEPETRALRLHWGHLELKVAPLIIKALFTLGLLSAGLTRSRDQVSLHSHWDFLTPGSGLMSP